MYIGVITNFQKNLTMNFKFRITKYLAVSALAVLLLGACSKNNIYMDVAYPNGEENNGGEEGNNDNPDKRMHSLLSVLP